MLLHLLSHYNPAHSNKYHICNTKCHICKVNTKNVIEWGSPCHFDAAIIE